MDRDMTALELEPRMSDADALLWSIEKDPLLRSTITSIHILDGAPDRDRLLRRIERGSRRIPRLRQRVVSVPLSLAPPRWELDPHFDLRYHVRFIRAVGEGTMQELFDIAEPIAMQGFDRARPLWELTVVEGLADGRAALVVKIHHTITDGIGALRLQDELVDAERDPLLRPEDDMPAAPQPPGGPDGRRPVEAVALAVADEAVRQVRGVGGAVTAALSSVGRLREDPVGVATGTVRNVVSVARMLAPAVEPLSPLMTGRSLSVRFGRIDLPQAPLETAARMVSGRLNDSIVAGLAGGLSLYHRHRGHDDVHAVRLAMPLDRMEERSHPRGAAVTDRFAPMRFTVPLDVDDPLERLAAIRLLVDRERSEPGLGLSAPLANLVNRLPATATTALFGSLVRGVDVIAAHVAGPEGPAYLAGAAIEAQVAFGPLAGAGLSVAWIADGDTVNLGVSMDPAAVPDPDVLLDCLTDGYDEIRKLV
jgi:WS/DGAT/MGAT family acyltransferase